MPQEAYCVKCKAMKPIHDPKPVVFKNGRHATQGTCSTCGTRVNKIGAA